MLDVHSHAVPADLVELLAREGPAHDIAVRLEPDGRRRAVLAGVPVGLPFLPALSDVDARIDWATAAGVDRQVVAGWMDLAGYHLEPAAGAWLARVQNDALADELGRTPGGRAIGAAAVPLQDPVTAAAELRRTVRELGFRAVQIGTHVCGRGLDESEFDPFWIAVQDLDVAVIVHPAELELPERMQRHFLGILVGNPSETTLAAATMLLGGVFDRHPRLRVLFVHGGGFVPYQLGRLVRGYHAAPPSVRSQAARPPNQYGVNLYFDTVLHDFRAVAFLIETVGTSQVMIGSDYPFPLRDAQPGTVLTALPDLKPADTAAIATGNALRWLGLSG